MDRLALLFVCAFVLVLPATASAQSAPPPASSIKANPDPAWVGDTVKLVGRDWLTRTAAGGTCGPRVRLAVERPGTRPRKIGAARLTSRGTFVFRWRVRDLIGNRAQTHGRTLGLKINGSQTCYENGRAFFLGSSGQMTIIGASITAKPAFPAVGDELTVRGRDWASRTNCERRVRLSLRRSGTTVKLGRPRVRERRFSFDWRIEGVQPADDWRLVAVQRCEDGRERFSIRRRMGPVQINPAPEPPPEEGPRPRY